MDVEEKKFTMMLPAAPGLCPVCATKHEAGEPHDLHSLFYQTKFKMENGRAPTWDDAMAHCCGVMREMWKEELEKEGAL